MNAPENVAGYAVAFDGNIVVKTVSPSERAAKVNGLGVLFGVVVMDGDSDAEIERAWDRITRSQPVAVIAVWVVPA